jgi:hypothetical protein
MILEFNGILAFESIIILAGFFVPAEKYLTFNMGLSSSTVDIPITIPSTDALNL